MICGSGTVEPAPEPRQAPAVKWDDYLQLACVRAVEEADARDEIWDGAVLRAATVAHRGDPVARARELLGKARASSLLSSLRAPELPGWMAALGAGVTLVFGWFLAALGQEREINLNLLALPLIGILLWNAGVLALSLFHGLRQTSSEKAPPSW